jgi:transmembrane sensor
MNHADFSSSHQPPEGDAAGPSALDWPRRAGATEEILAELNARVQRRAPRRRLAFAAVAAAGVLAAGLLWQRSLVPAFSRNSVMSIVVVAAAHQTLPDGSTVDLKDGAEIGIAYTPEVRAVTLRHGTARFQVAKNKSRPFVVTAGNVAVRAVGTAFCVGLESKSIEVIVTEGRVTVAQTAPAQPTFSQPSGPLGSALVGAGEHVVVEGELDAIRPLVFAVAPLESQDLAEKLNWLSPRLEFTGTPLEMVVMTFNQHNRRQLVLGDPDLRGLRLSGILRSNNIPALLRMLEANFQIAAEDRGDSEIILRKAP